MIFVLKSWSFLYMDKFMKLKNMMNKNIYLFFVLLTGYMSLNAQNVEFKSKNFKNNKNEYKIAVNNIKQGDEYLEQGEQALINKTNTKMYFKNALEFYNKAQNFNPDNDELNYKTGKCLLQTYNKISAMSYLEKAVKLNPDVENETYFLLGQAYKYDYKFKQAKQQFKIYEKKLRDKQFEKVKRDVKKELKECDIAIQLVENPARVWVTNLKNINTEYPEYCAAISADEDMMIFNSKRPNTTGEKKDDDGFYFSDIYVSYKEKNNKWSNPENMEKPLNTEAQDECLALSPDGQNIFIYKQDPDGNIYKSELFGDKWSKPEKLVKKINSEYNETHASFSYNGIKIYYISDQQNSEDIFFSGNKNGIWGKGQKIGDKLNTIYNEGSIYMHPDGKTLYFSSKGHNSMGGYDIFKSVRGDDGRWKKPVNLGYPVNTPYDETFFVMSANGKHAYVTSNREKQGKGQRDIYKIIFLGPEKSLIIDNEDNLLANFNKSMNETTLESPVEIETKNLTVLKGRILDDVTLKPVKAKIEIADNKKNEIIAIFKSNSKTGKFLISLPSGINYGIAVKAQGYLFHSENFDLPVLSDYQLVNKDIKLKNISIGNKIILRNIFFNTGKSILGSESTTELKRVIKLLNDVPQLKVEISGHTDNIGLAEYNQNLSEDRANAVVNYLIKNNINKTRLTYKGYGFTKPIATNDTEQGRQLNRRTEMKITGN